jgi:hypothetical protein
MHEGHAEVLEFRPCPPSALQSNYGYNPFNHANHFHPAYSSNQAVRQKKRSMITGRTGTEGVGSLEGTYSRWRALQERRNLEAMLFILFRWFLR